MLNPYLLRNNINEVAKKLARKKFVLDIETFCKQENLRKILQKETENLQKKRNSISKLMRNQKFNKQENEHVYHDVKIFAERLHDSKTELSLIKRNIYDYSLSFPNIPDDEIPDGCTSLDNIEVLRWGELHKYNFRVRDHVELGMLANGLDFSSAVKLAGPRFVVMRGKIALLYRALSQFMLNLHTQKHGYEEYYLPYVANRTSLCGTGQLPKFSEDLFHIKSFDTQSNTHSYALIPTAEVPLTNIFRNKILDEKDLPCKLTANTPCFRSEAGSYGRDTRGLIRLHQFDKVELVQIVSQEKSMQALEDMTSHAEKVLQLLNLPYRKMLLCAGDTSFSACKTYDLEVWFPSQNNYREVSSCSNTSDFQARRLKARYKNNKNKKIKLLHTLNGSGLAIGRTLAALLENYQMLDGRVYIPEILQPYMQGITYIG